jgi:hypothetical protein
MSRDALMEYSPGRRGVWFAMALLFCAYVAFVIFSRPSNYGLALQPDSRMTWSATRLLTFGVWLGLGAVLLAVRRSPIAWRSFTCAFLATCALAIVIAPSLVPAAASYASIAGTIGAYASASGFACITVVRPLPAIGFGTLLLPAQLVLDATAHVLSGQVPLH